MDVSELLQKEDHVYFQNTSVSDPFNSGNITMSGNGYLGFRGTFPHWGADQYMACTVTDTFDCADGKWTELCTVPNGLVAKIFLEGRELTLESPLLQGQDHGLDFDAGLSYGSATWQLPRGGQVELRWERFASMDKLHLVPQKLELRSTASTHITVQLGIDRNIWSLNGDHFPRYRFDRHGESLLFEAETSQTALPVVVAHGARLPASPDPSSKRTEGLYQVDLKLDPDAPAILEQFMVVYTANDTPNPRQAVMEQLSEATRRGYDEALADNRRAWEHIWSRSSVKIHGNHLAQQLVKYNMYHNIIATPAHSDHHPIGARGLSCQGYQGAAFWDQEIYNLPMFLYTQPEIARNILIYRYKTLAGAKAKAQRLGYAGAYYPWISGNSGDELCPDYFFIDVLSGRKIRNHFNDWQIHISPDISFTVVKYYEATGDWDFMVDYGSEILMEVAMFLFSRVHFNSFKDRYEILRVLGPDEYHENADNNAFTNVQSKYALEKTLEVVRRLGAEQAGVLKKLREKTGFDPSVEAKIEDVAAKLYIPPADPRTKLIEQFDGYFNLEDITPGALAERLIDEQEYWGWPNGIAYETQVTKQADVVQMFVLHPHDSEVMKANYHYYEPRTQHRSSLSPGTHAIVAAQIGDYDQAYRYFLKSCSVDLVNSHPPTSGGTFIGGIHTAACGIAWQIVVRGFAAMKLHHGVLSFDPRLPEQWDGVEFSLVIGGASMTIAVTSQQLVIEVHDKPQTPIEVRVGIQTNTIDGPQRIEFPLNSHIPGGTQ